MAVAVAGDPGAAGGNDFAEHPIYCAARAREAATVGSRGAAGRVRWTGSWLVLARRIALALEIDEDSVR